MSIPEGFMKEAYEQMTEDIKEELAETIISNVRVKNPAHVRKTAWNMIESSIQKTLKEVTEMFLHNEINKAEYEMMIHIISIALQKIKTMHT